MPKPADAAHEDQRNRGKVDQFAFRRVFRTVTRRDVRNFVRHHAGQFGFVVGSENQTAVDVEESAGKRERVDFVGFDDFDREWNLRVGVPDEILADAVDVFVDRRIVDQLDLAFDFRGQLAAHRDLFFERDEVDAALVDVAISDVVDIGILRLFAFLLSSLSLSLLSCRCLCSLFASSRTLLPALSRHRLSLGQEREGNRDQKGQNKA